MNNYEYIIAGLPVLFRDRADRNVPDADEIIAEVMEQLSAKDRATASLLLDGFNPDNLDAGFYVRTGSSGNSFVERYFEFDRRLRNTKVVFINKALGRADGEDILLLKEDEEFEQDPAIMEVLEKNDLIGREKGLDSLIWDFVEEQNSMRVFDLNVILGFMVKLKITDRWLKLDPESGRRMFEKLVKETRNSI